jgi:hypothetical protein
MAYQGSTAASSVANPPRALISRFAGVPASTQLSTAVGANTYREQGGGVWLYMSSHGSTATQDSNFFTDAWYIGIRPGDLMFGVQWTTLGSSLVFYMGVFGSVSTAGAALTTGGTITSTFN